MLDKYFKSSGNINGIYFWQKLLPIVHILRYSKIVILYLQFIFL